MNESSNVPPSTDWELEDRVKALYGIGKDGSYIQALAPMVRASSTAMRTLALHYGADVVYTEEFIDRAISATERVVNDKLDTIDYVKGTTHRSKRMQRKYEGQPGPVLLRIDPKIERRRMIGQIGTGEPELALPAALNLVQDVDAIDINMGCPKKFSVSGGMGSALLEDPDRACRIVKTLCGTLNPMQVPVSTKIRLLPGNDTRSSTMATLDFCQGLVEAGASAIAIHGRYVGDEATTAAKWDQLEDVVKHIKSKYSSTPILLNGDFYTRKETDEMIAKTTANGVLLARPALYNCSIFRKEVPQLMNKMTVVQDYVKLAVRYNAHYKNAKYVVGEMLSNRRTPFERVPQMPQLSSPTIADTSVCQSLQDLCRLWNVDHDSSVYNKDCIQTDASADEHRYSDDYFLPSFKPTEAKVQSENATPLLHTELVVTTDTHEQSTKRLKTSSA